MLFENSVVNELKSYVYRLIDPRNGETFYVGKGKGNRVFDHTEENDKLEKSEEDEISLKLQRIRKIKESGLNALHVIHRHGMDEQTALIVEAALIDAYPGLTNLQAGKYSGDYGVMHVEEIKKRYAAQIAEFNDKVMLININKSASELSIYDAVRFSWKIDPKKANKAKYILATHQGMIKGAYQPDEKGWIDATAMNFPGRTTVPGRYGFIGKYAPKDIQNLYVGKQVPEKFRKKGASNPIRYSW